MASDNNSCSSDNNVSSRTRVAMIPLFKDIYDILMHNSRKDTGTLKPYSLVLSPDSVDIVLWASGYLFCRAEAGLRKLFQRIG